MNENELRSIIGKAKRENARMEVIPGKEIESIIENTGLTKAEFARLTAIPANSIQRHCAKGIGHNPRQPRAVMRMYQLMRENGGLMVELLRRIYKEGA